MRILYSHYLAQDGHPAVRMIQAISDGLRTMGHEVFIHRSFGPEVAFGGNIKGKTNIHHEFLRNIRGRLWFAKAMVRNRAMMQRDLLAIKKYRPEIVLARQDAYCWSMPKACGQTQTPLVSHADAPVAYETRTFPEVGRWHPPRIVEAIECWGLSRSRAIITVSNPAANLLKAYNLPVPVFVIHNGVHPERFPELSKEEREATRRELGLTAKTVIGFQGTFRPFHGLDLLRELMLASGSCTDIQWLLIGDGPHRRALEKAVAGRVPAIFTGMQPPGRIGHLSSLIDVAVVPHADLSQNFYFCPLKVLELAAAGCAVIASRQGDIPLLLDGGRAGLLVSQPDIRSWRDALFSLLADDDYRQSLGQSARHWVLSNLTWQHTARRVAGVLQHALTGEALTEIEDVKETPKCVNV